MNENNNQSLSLFEYTFFSQFFFCRSFYSTQWCCFSSSFWLAHLEIQSKLFMNILFFAQEIFFSFFIELFPFSAPLQNRFDSITHQPPSHHLNPIPFLYSAEHTMRCSCLTSELALLDPLKELTWLTRGWRAVFSRLWDENTSTHVYINSLLSTAAVILLHFTWSLGWMKMEWKTLMFFFCNWKIVED